MASSVYFARSKYKNGGTLYALDLIGSCAGGLLVSARLVPVYGLLRAAALLTPVNLAVATLSPCRACSRQHTMRQIGN